MKTTPDISKGQSGDVVNDAFTAKSMGLSYGQYKTGAKKESTCSDYSVRSTDFLKRGAESSEDTKAVAFIK